MPAMTCEKSAQLAGWRCQPVDDGARQALYVVTPM